MVDVQIRHHKILIVGGTGSLGKVLISRLLGENKVVVFSRDEAKQWSLKNEYRNHPDSKKLSFEIGDMRDRERVREIARNHFDVVIIAGALKQVDTCELVPLESIKTNILGVQNVVDAVSESMMGCTVCMVSSDKACHPVNTYGMCKSIAERVVLEHARRDTKGNRYVAVRYGNVLESRGSIIPLFKHQAEHSDAFTLTHPDMTRFTMTLDQSVDLIEKTTIEGKSGETWIPKLSSMRIKDLAEIFADKYNKPIKVIGMRPGEKIHESLISDTETFRAYMVTDQYYALSPAYKDLPSGGTKMRELGEYTSKNDLLTKQELFDHLKNLGVLDIPIDKFVGKSIEDIRT